MYHQNETFHCSEIPGRGRCLIANKDIPIGTVVLQQLKPEVLAVGFFTQDISSLHPLQTKGCDLACGWCFAADCSLLRCGACKGAYYCSRECQKLSWDAHHSHECPFIKLWALIYTSRNGKQNSDESNARLHLKLECRLAFQILSKIVSAVLISRRCGDESISHHVKSDEDLGNYETDDEIWRLVISHWTEWSEPEFKFIFGEGAKTTEKNKTLIEDVRNLYRLSPSIKHFVNDGIGNIVRPPSDAPLSEHTKFAMDIISLMTKYISDPIISININFTVVNKSLRKAFINGMRYLCMSPVFIRFILSQIQLNAFTVTDPNYSSSVGAGVYSSCSLFNHSCIPNCLRTFDYTGPQMTVKSIGDISQHSELCITYLDVAESIKDRQDALAQQYGFKCVCPLCSETATEAQERDMKLTCRRIQPLRGSMEDILNSDPLSKTDNSRLLNATFYKFNPTKSVASYSHPAAELKLFEDCQSIIDKLNITNRLSASNDILNRKLVLLEEDRNTVMSFLLFAAMYYYPHNLRCYNLRNALGRAMMDAGGCGDILTYATFASHIHSLRALYGDVTLTVCYQQFLAAKLASWQDGEAATQGELDHYSKALKNGRICMGPDNKVLKQFEAFGQELRS